MKRPIMFVIAVALIAPVLLWAQSPGNWDYSMRTLTVTSATAFVDVNSGASTSRFNATSIGSTSNNDFSLIANNVQALSVSAAQAGLVYVAPAGLAGAELRIATPTVIGTFQPGFFGTTTATNMVLLANNNQIGKICSGGGMTLGSPDPTGGCKGNGILNVSGDIKKNDTAYTNPDYVFEAWDTGTVKRFAHNDGAASYRGLMPIGELESYVREHYRLPQIHRKPMGIFERADVLLEIVEQQQLYIFDLNRRIAALEAAQGKQ